MEGDILFLEEDDVVSPDYFKSSTIMSHLKKTHPGIYSFSMGTDCHTKRLPECLSGAPNEYKMKTIFTTKYFFQQRYRIQQIILGRNQGIQHTSKIQFNSRLGLNDLPT